MAEWYDRQSKANLAAYVVKLEADLAAARAENERLTKALNENKACNRGLVRLNEAVVARAEKAEAERDEWKAEYQTANNGLNVYRNKNAELVKERDEARAQVVGAFEAAASVAWADRESGLTVNTKIRALTPDDAQAALQSMLADAERDMRQRAADTAREAWRDGYDAAAHILALPLKLALEGGV